MVEISQAIKIYVYTDGTGTIVDRESRSNGLQLDIISGK